MMKKTIFWDGLKNENNECYLQPIYDVEKKKVTVAEALFRSRDGKGGFHDTENLIQFAESMDCVSRIDLWVLEQVCKNMEELRKLGIERVNVNLSPKSYLDEELLKDIKRIMEAYDVWPKHIWFELTEITEVGDKEMMTDLIDRMVKQGFHFAIDDFGKGNSNILRLMEFPFASIKLDKELIWKLKEKPMVTDMVQTLIQFSRRHNICVTAEGIENKEQASALIDMGCHFLQGYLFSKPMPIPAFIDFIQEDHDFGLDQASEQKIVQLVLTAVSGK